MAAGTVTQGKVKKIENNVRVIEFACVGSDADGTIPDTDITEANMQEIRGYGLDTVEVDPGATPPDAADVLVSNTYGIDLLDGNGTNLIHATDSKATIPATDGQVKLSPVFETLTVSVANQDTVDAIWSIRLIFIRL